MQGTLGVMYRRNLCCVRVQVWYNAALYSCETKLMIFMWVHPKVISIFIALAQEGIWCLHSMWSLSVTFHINSKQLCWQSFVQHLSTCLVYTAYIKGQASLPWTTFHTFIMPTSLTNFPPKDKKPWVMIHTSWYSEPDIWCADIRITYTVKRS